MPTPSLLPNEIRGLLIDLAGVIHVGDEALPGVAQTLAAVRERGLPMRFLTNTTRNSRSTIAAKLATMRLEIPEAEIITAVSATQQYISTHSLHPHLLVHPAIADEMGASAAEPDAVVIGDAADGFSFAAMNEAFRLLMQGLPLIAMARNRYFQESDGLTIDMGAYVTALEFAAGVEATVIGKPAPAFFQAALTDMGIRASEAVMIGDDLRDDVQGAQACGIAGILVCTGKYRVSDEAAPGQAPALIADDFAAAIQSLLAQ